MWPLTVPKPIERFAAISAFDLPPAISSKTCVSRSVSGERVARAGMSGRPNPRSTTWATRGSKYTPPSAAILTASSTRSGRDAFRQYASAPAARAAITSSSRSCIVRMTTCVFGCAWRIRPVSAIPSSPGKPISTTATSGASAVANSNPLGPSAASPTTSNPPSRASAVTRPARVKAWSSTTMTRIRSGTRCVDRKRKKHGEAAAPRRRRFVCGAAAVTLGDPSYDVQTESRPGSVACTGREPLEQRRSLRLRNPEAVILDLQNRLTAVVLDRDGDVPAALRRRYRVCEQVDEHAAQLALVSGDRARDVAGHAADAHSIVASERFQLCDDIVREDAEIDESSRRRLFARFVLGDHQQSFGEPLQLIIGIDRAPQYFDVRRRQVAERAVKRLPHRHAGGGKRRAKIVRKRVDDIADDLAALDGGSICRLELFVLRGELHEKVRLRDRGGRFIGKRLRDVRHLRVERLLRVLAQDDDQALAVGLAAERHGDTMSRTQCVESESAHRVRGGEHGDLTGFPHAREHRSEFRRRSRASEIDVAHSALREVLFLGERARAAREDHSRIRLQHT